MAYIDYNGKYHSYGHYPNVSNPFAFGAEEYAGREYITDSDTMFFYYDGQLLGRCNADSAECSNLLELMRSDRDVATGVLNYLNSFGDPIFPISDEQWDIAETNINRVNIYDLYNALMEELDHQYSDMGEVYVEQIPGVEIWVSNSSQVVASTYANKSNRYFANMVNATNYIDAATNNPAITITKVNGNWTCGYVELPSGQCFDFCAKHFEEPSEFGINSGRISILSINYNGNCVCNYDRGWDTKPKLNEARQAYKILLDEFN